MLETIDLTSSAEEGFQQPSIIGGGEGGDSILERVRSPVRGSPENIFCRSTKIDDVEATTATITSKFSDSDFRFAYAMSFLKCMQCFVGCFQYIST
ncbi:hypothetical protein ACFX12_013237 [Malus domestica]